MKTAHFFQHIVLYMACIVMLSGNVRHRHNQPEEDTSPSVCGNIPLEECRTHIFSTTLVEKVELKDVELESILTRFHLDKAAGVQALTLEVVRHDSLLEEVSLNGMGFKLESDSLRIRLTSDNGEFVSLYFSGRDGTKVVKSLLTHSLPLY